jgi:hypothetical protein
MIVQPTADAKRKSCIQAGMLAHQNDLDANLAEALGEEVWFAICKYANAMVA